MFTVAIWNLSGQMFVVFQRLKQLTKRQVDLNFEQLVQRYQAKQKEQEDLAFKAKYVETIYSFFKT